MSLWIRLCNHTYIHTYYRKDSRITPINTAAMLDGDTTSSMAAGGVTRRKLQTPGNAEEHQKKQETPTINLLVVSRAHARR